MIVLITGASHTGKTLLAQHMLERFGYPYLSIGDDSLPSQLESERCRGVQLVFTRFRARRAVGALQAYRRRMARAALAN